VIVETEAITGNFYSFDSEVSLFVGKNKPEFIWIPFYHPAFAFYDLTILVIRKRF
jgi:hypothetical protein